MLTNPKEGGFSKGKTQTTACGTFIPVVVHLHIYVYATTIFVCGAEERAFVRRDVVLWPVGLWKQAAGAVDP